MSYAEMAIGEGSSERGCESLAISCEWDSSYAKQAGLTDISAAAGGKRKNKQTKQTKTKKTLTRLFPWLAPFPLGVISFYTSTQLIDLVGPSMWVGSSANTQTHTQGHANITPNWRNEPIFERHSAEQTKKQDGLLSNLSARLKHTHTHAGDPGGFSNSNWQYMNFFFSVRTLPPGGTTLIVTQHRPPSHSSREK